MDLHKLQEQWDALGEEDPLWAILSHPEKRGNQWNVDEFLATGRSHVQGLLARSAEAGIDVPRQRALDFGCGAGRLTQALAEHFDGVDGIDIAPSMIELAKQMNRYEERCRYHLNEKPDLSLFATDTFDFILSYIVLQHMEPQYAEGYIREFVRVLKPGGFLVFQLPSENARSTKGVAMRLLNTPVLRPLLNAYRRRRDRCAHMAEMHGIKRCQVEKILADCGATARFVHDNRAGGATWNSYEYWVCLQPEQVLEHCSATSTASTASTTSDQEL